MDVSILTVLCRGWGTIWFETKEVSRLGNRGKQVYFVLGVWWKPLDSAFRSLRVAGTTSQLPIFSPSYSSIVERVLCPVLRRIPNFNWRWAPTNNLRAFWGYKYNNLDSQNTFRRAWVVRTIPKGRVQGWIVANVTQDEVLKQNWAVNS